MGHSRAILLVLALEGTVWFQEKQQGKQLPDCPRIGSGAASIWFMEEAADALVAQFSSKTFYS